MYNLFINKIDNTFVIITDDLLESMSGLIAVGIIVLISSSESIVRLQLEISKIQREKAFSVFSLN